MEKDNRKSAVTIHGKLVDTVSKPPSISLVTESFLAASWNSILDAKVA